jgi:class 3 adenylate cyclase/Tfp pilus assembly protein PilF
VNANVEITIKQSYSPFNMIAHSIRLLLSIHKLKCVSYFTVVFVFVFELNAFGLIVSNDYLNKIYKAEKLLNQQIDTANLVLRQEENFSFPGIDLIFNKLLTQAEINKYDLGLAKVNLNYGIYLYSKGRYETSINALLNAIKIYEKLDLKAEQADVNNQLTRVYISLSEVQPNENTTVESKIPGMYLKSKELDRAESYCRKALNYNKINNRLSMMASNYNNLGVIKEKKMQLDSAEYFFNEAYKYYEKLGDVFNKANILNNLGIVFEFQGMFEQELKSYQDALKLFEEINDTVGIAISNGNIANVFYSNGECKEGLVFAQKGYDLAAHTQKLPIKKDMLYTLFVLYDCLGDCDKKSYFFNRYIEVKDSIFNIESKKILEDVNAQYETEKKENQILLLSKSKELDETIKKALSAGIALTVIIVLVVFRSYKQKQKANVLLTTQNEIIESERKKSDALLLNILPVETAEELKEKGFAEARTFESVTVMFTDFKDFTKVAEMLDAKSLVKEIDSVFKKFDEIITNHNIEKIKTIGDAYMAAAGLPIENKTHATDMVMAALEILNTIEEIKLDRKNNGLPFFEIRIGIHTGPVVAGIVGTKKFAYDIWGDAVNVASRMESSGEAGKINISGSTYALIKDQFICDYRGKVTAKNKGEIDMYFVEKHL